VHGLRVPRPIAAGGALGRSGKTHLATRACQAGHRVLFATVAQWVARLARVVALG
jgi:DNA replication protein DnaC